MWECFDVNFETAMGRDTNSMMNTDLYTLDIWNNMLLTSVQSDTLEACEFFAPLPFL